MALTAPPAGWYHRRPDPDELRYWDGHGWTDERRRVPQPGWYPNPQDPNGVRYWNGTAWISDATPAAAAQTPVVPEPAAAAPPTPSSAPVAPPWPAEPIAPAPRPAAPTPSSAPVAPPWPAEPVAAAPGVAAPTPPSAPVAPPWAVAPNDPSPALPNEKEGPVEAVARFRATAVPPPDGTAEAVAKLRATPAGQPDGHEDASSDERPGRSRVLLAVEAIVLLFVVVIGGFLLLTKAGLSLGGSSAPPPVQAPAGYRVVSVPAAGVEFAVPSTWLGVDPSSPTVKQDLQRVAAENPQLSGFAASTSNIKYLAVDRSNPLYNANVEVLNLGVTKAALSNAVAIQSAFRNEIPNAAAVPTTIAGTRGLTLTGTVPVTLPNGAHITVHATAYIVGTSTGVYTLIFGTTDDASQDANVQTALHTLQLLP